MTGVSIEQWRGNIGLFNRKSIFKKYLKECNDYTVFLITIFLHKLLHLLRVPFEILSSLLLLFFYCIMIVTLFPISLTVYLCLDNLLCYDSCNTLFYKSFLYSIKIVLEINILPRKISNITKYSFSLLKKYLPKSLTNALFFYHCLANPSRHLR